MLLLKAWPGDVHSARRTMIVAGFIVLLLYCLGAMHWIAFFDSGRMAFASQDWPKEYRYYSILRTALQQHTLPFHTSTIFQDTDRFLALPETNLSPQIMLLPLMQTGRFIMCNVVLLYSAGFIGCLLLGRKFGLSLVPFTVLFLLFNFNGHITAHLAVGHSMWAGYFLLPFILLAVFRLTEKPSSLTGPFAVSLTLFILLLQGSFHFYIWCLMLLALIALCNRSCRRAACYAMGGSILLSSFRLFPAAVAFMGRHEEFVTGYPTLAHLVESFTIIRSHTYDVSGILGSAGWWEFDLYTGVIGFLFIIYFGIYRGFIRQGNEEGKMFAPFALPLLLLFIFSLDYFYAPIASLPVPLAGCERVSSRFIILPYVMVVLAGCVRLEEMLALYPGRTVKLLSAAAVLETMFALATHSWAWRIANIDNGAEAVAPAGVSIVTRSDWLYEFIVKSSAVVSLSVLLAAIIWLIKKLNFLSLMNKDAA